MSTPSDTPLSLWHGLAANWQRRVAQHLLDTAQATVASSLSLQRDLSAARNLTDVAAAQGAATQRLMETWVERTNAFSQIGSTLGEEIAASIRPAAEAPTPSPAE